MAPWQVDWDRIAEIVKAGGYAGANDEFNQLRTGVMGADAATLAAQAEHARLGWTFIVNFAAKKPMYRSHLVKVVKALLTSAEWHRAYLESTELHEKVGLLHADLQAVLSVSVVEAVTPAPSPSAPARVAQHTTRTSQLQWPSWQTIDRIVARDAFGSSTDEFNALRAVANDATPVEIEAEAASAEIAWAFLIGFAEAKKVFRSQIVQVVTSLGAVPSWQVALSSRPDLVRKASALHPDLIAAFGLTIPVPCRSWTNQPSQPLQGFEGDVGVEPEPDIEDHQWELIQAAPVETVKQDNDSELQSRLAAMAGAIASATASTSQGASQRAVVEPPAVPAAAHQPASALPAREPAMPAAAPSSLVKRMQPFLQRAAELEGTDLLVSYYCRVHVVEQVLLARKRGEADDEAMKLVMSNFQHAEVTKKKLDLSAGRQTMEDFAWSSYVRAVEADVAAAMGSDSADASLHTQLYVSSLFLEVLAQFHDGTLPPQIHQASQYAKTRSVHLLQCVKSGSKPHLPAPPVLPQLQSRLAAASAQVPSMPPAAPPAAAQPPASKPSQVSAVAPQVHQAVFSPEARSVAVPATAKSSAPLSSKKQAEVQKISNAAAAALAGANDQEARRLIVEALQLLDGP